MMMSSSLRDSSSEFVTSPTMLLDDIMNNNTNNNEQQQQQHKVTRKTKKLANAQDRQVNDEMQNLFSTKGQELEDLEESGVFVEESLDLADWVEWHDFVSKLRRITPKAMSSEDIMSHRQ